MTASDHQPTEQDALITAIKNKLDALFYAFSAVFPDALDAGIRAVVEDRQQAEVDARFAHLTEDLDTAGDDADTQEQ